MESRCWLIVVLIFAWQIAHGSAVSSLNITQHEGEFNKIMKFMFNGSYENVVVFPTSNSVNPFRITAWSFRATVRYPILVVVRQEREVLSWQVPFLVDTSKRDVKLIFHNTSRTLCHNNMEEITKTSKGRKLNNKPWIRNVTQNFIVAVSTSAPVPVDIYLKVEEESDFYVSTGVDYRISVSPSQTRYVYYVFPNDTESVLVAVNSDDDICLTVSVQDSFCPVFDLDKDITYEGAYQTVNRKGAISIMKRKFPLGFFLVFVAKGDNFECSQENSILPIPRATSIAIANRTSIVTFRITKSISGNEYRMASLYTLLAILCFYVVAVSMVWCFTRWGSLSKVRRKTPDEMDGVIRTIDLPSEPSNEQIHELLMRKSLPLRMLAQYPETDKRRSFNYLWHIISIAIFYSIPVVQLVITYQRMVNQTGDQDLCYYNFMCAHPALGLSDFNHIFSNTGYVFIGILFLLVSLHRHAIVKDRPVRGVGIPVHYGLFYAMGIALIIEGLLSACYHICPSQSNYQFDTSFMYVMAVLCMVKLYQNRHPDINATAYATFTVLGIAIFLAMVGILNGTLTVWIIFAVAYSLLTIYISFKIYFLSYIIDGLTEFKKDIKVQHINTKTFKPTRKGRFILLVIANLVNYAMLTTGLCLYDSGVTDFGTFLLGLLMGNAVLHTIFYTCMKLVHGERICIEAICYGILMIASWGGSVVFFLDYATLWTVTPAESRQRNQDCILMNFYDKHDVWHLLSAPALYFSFMYLMCLDDDLVDKKQNEITVF